MAQDKEKKTRSNDLVEIFKPEIPLVWDYNESVEKVRAVFYRWKNLTLDIAQELYIARERLSSRYHRDDGTKVPTWAQYCEDIGSSKRVVNRWLAG